MKPVALVRASVLTPVVETLASRGAPVEALLRRAWLPAHVRQDEQLIPFHLALRFLAEAARTQRIPELGLVAGEAASIERMGVLGRLLRGAGTLGEALATLFAVTPSFTSGERWWLAAKDDESLVCHTFIDPSRDGHVQADHYGVALAINLVRIAAGPDWTPREVRFETGAIGRLAERTGLFRGTRILHSQPFSSVAFPTDLLAGRLPRTGLLREHDERLEDWYATGPAGDFPRSVQQVMWSLSSADGHPSMRSTATALGISIRTLQRRLAESGLSFKDLLRADRLRMAIWCLERTRTRVLDIALDLGYSDHAHFTRAFRRWTGVTPFEYRRAWIARRERVATAATPTVASGPQAQALHHA